MGYSEWEIKQIKLYRQNHMFFLGGGVCGAAASRDYCDALLSNLCYAVLGTDCMQTTPVAVLVTIIILR